MEYFKSPRQLEEEIKQANYEEFEKTMQRVDKGEITLSLGLAALRGEFVDE